MKTLEGNKLIAEFMGFREEKTGDGNIIVRPDGFACDKYPTYLNWNNLMPVLEKIESLGYYSSIDYFGQHRIFLINSSEGVRGDTKIQCVYEGVVEFVKWYNENTK